MDGEKYPGQERGRPRPQQRASVAAASHCSSRRSNAQADVFDGVNEWHLKNERSDLA
jgi:hypothetical protein